MWNGWIKIAEPENVLNLGDTSPRRRGANRNFRNININRSHPTQKEQKEEVRIAMQSKFNYLLPPMTDEIEIINYNDYEVEAIILQNILNQGYKKLKDVLTLPLYVCTGDGYDINLQNSVFNQLREQARPQQIHKNKRSRVQNDESTLDMLRHFMKKKVNAISGRYNERTKKLANHFTRNHKVNNITGRFATGRESFSLHAYARSCLQNIPNEHTCTLKIFTMNSNTFKACNKYVETDYRFRNQCCNQNSPKFRHNLAAKEMKHLKILTGIVNCPKPITVRDNILMTSFIGSNDIPATQINNLVIKPNRWQYVYNEITEAMQNMFQQGHIINAALSQFNISWRRKICWFTDFAQSVRADHPNALEFLRRDCINITKFFEKKGLKTIRNEEELFKFVTGYEDENIDVHFQKGVHVTHYRLTSLSEFELIDSVNADFPFEYFY